MEQSSSMPTADTHSYSSLTSLNKSPTERTDNRLLQDMQITEASATNTTFEDFLLVAHVMRQVDSSQLYDLATSILEECKKATPNRDISTVVHLLNGVLGLHSVPHPNPLVRLAEALCTKQNESSDEALPMSGGMINKCAVLLSVILTYSFTNHVVCLLERPSRRVDVKIAIGLFREGVELLPIHHPLRVSSCCRVADALYTHFEQLGEREDLDEAISLHRDALELYPAGDPNRSATLNNLANSLATRYEQSSEREDLDEAISLHRDALELFPAGHPNRSACLSNLANSLTTRFGQSGGRGDVDEAISLHRDALELQPAGHPDRSVPLDNLATSLTTRFKQSGERGDIDEAISLHRDALELFPAGHPDRSRSLNNLAVSLTTRFKQSGEHGDLDEAISLHRDALKLFPVGNPLRPGSLNNLANSLAMRFEQSGEHENLDEAISLYRDALELFPAGHPRRSGSLNNLAASLRTRFEQSGEHDDLLHEAISLYRDALELQPAGHPDRSDSLNNLAASLRTRFEQSGEREDLDEVISLHQNALELFPAGHPNRSGFLNNFASSLAKRFGWSGEPEDLDEAILLYRGALELRPAGHPDRSHSLNGLATLLITRFAQSGEHDDLHEAISLHRDALELRPDGHPNRSDSLNNLAASLRTRFEQSGEHEDLDESISLHRDALELRPASHPNRSGSLNNLAASLRTRFEQSGEREDLDEAISLHRDALELQPAGHPDRSTSLNHLASSLTTRFEKSGEQKDLDEALELFPESINSHPSGHPYICYFSVAFGCALMHAYCHTQAPKYIEKAMATYRDAVTYQNTSVSSRFSAATFWAQYADEHSHKSAVEAYQAAVELLPGLAMLGSALQVRQRALTSGSDGLARNAAACAIRWRRYDKAVELLEEGRAIFWSQALELRTPMIHLHEVAPVLESRLKSLSFALEQGSLRDTSRNLTDSPQKLISMEQEARHFRRLNTEWLETLAEVRRLPGFQDFLRPSRLSILQSAAVDAPVVILNASDSGCDTLILTSSDVKHIPLRNLSFTVINQLVRLIRMATPGSSLRQASLLPMIDDLFRPMSFDSDTERSLRQLVEGRAGKSVSDTQSVDFEDIFRLVLHVLWISVMQPVIVSLNLEKSTNPPNLKWCPTGPFAFLPIHAAGIYTVNYTGETAIGVSDYVVSSYVPTIGSLLRVPTPTAHPTCSTKPFKMMVVIQPETLPSANQELQNIVGHVPNECLVKLGVPGAPATVNEVVSYLSGVTIAHFACHGKQDKKNPLESSLILEDGRLRISRIMQESTPNASIAFLCACETAMGSEGVPDEAMHLGATLLFAGFRGVVATMWSIADADGPKIADSFYEHLFKSYNKVDNIGPDTTQAAQALHHAVTKLRSENVSFARWVPFIHLGR